MNETIILINETDLKAGFIRVGTSLERMFQRVTRRVGPTGLIETKLSKKDGEITYWDMKVKKECLGKTLGLKNPEKRKASSGAFKKKPTS